MIDRTTALSIKLLVKGRPFGATTAAEAAVGEQGVGCHDRGGAIGDPVVRSVRPLPRG